VLGFELRAYILSRQVLHNLKHTTSPYCIILNLKLQRSFFLNGTNVAVSSIVNSGPFKDVHILISVTCECYPTFQHGRREYTDVIKLGIFRQTILDYLERYNLIARVLKREGKGSEKRRKCDL
jgi:hypothetical protein